jgi:hypothetical protein
MQYADGGQATMMPPTMPTVGSVMGTAPTTAQTLESIRQQALAIQAQIPGATGTTNRFNVPTPEGEPEQPWQPLTPQEERRIQREQMRLFQKEIDATNQIYDQMVSQARLEGQGRLGSQAAMGARAGLLGSDFQGAAEAGLQAETRGITSGLNAERSAKIAVIMGKGRQAAVDEIAAKNKANREGADAKIKFMQEKQDRKTRNLNMLAKSLVEQSIDPTTLSEEELAGIAASYGTTVEDINASYTSAKVAADANVEDNTFTLSEGQARYDADGNVIASRAKTYAPKDSDGVGTTLTSANKKTLLGGGWTQADISSLEGDVAQYGLTEVIANAKANGATASQIKALEKAYGAEEGAGEQFLSKQYFSNLFTTSQLEKAAVDAGFGDMGEGFFNLKDVDTEGYLNYLDKAIQSYRTAGYTDQEILKMMQ